ncbi:TPA: hypothetical protein N3A50_000327 [Salmonella enterica subsp. salamae serovar 30:g,m,s:e,n,x]|nr:hypothetical protein [Salmonella enterica subsp. salamae serovar 30:g,m,s:e,n,x]
MTNNKLTNRRTISTRIADILVADSVPLSDAWKRLIDDAGEMELELQELRRNYLALRGEIEGVRSQLYEAENQANEYASELQERRKAEAESKPVAAAYVVNGVIEADDFASYCGHPKFPDGKIELYAAPPVPEECPAELLAFCEQVIDSRITANAKADELWNACCAAMLQGSQPVSNRDELPVQ